jgi:ribonuclease HI
VLRRRGWHGPSICALCKDASEDSTHLFLQCAFTVNIWRRLCILFSLPEVWFGDSFISGLVSWLSIAAAPHPLVATVCWQIWKQRNRVIFEGRSSSPKAVFLCILSSLHFQQTSLKTIQHKALDYRLEEGATLACFDGAALSSGLCCGAGGTFKTHSSRITKWFLNCGEGTNTKAELLGLWATLYLASRWSLNHLHILGDSSVIVNWINHNHNLRSIHIEGWKQQTRELFNTFTDIKIQHISRAHNTEADALSKRALGDVIGKLSVFHCDNGKESYISTIIIF